MIITRSPLRVSFTGGGTDIPAFYEKYGPGVVVSTAIDRYIYASINEKFDGKVSVRYRVHEMVDSVEELKHPLIRECLLYFGLRKGVEIVITSEVPARGSGLGASSALACALCMAASLFSKGKELSSQELAEIASLIEIDRVGSPIGKQDHYASAFGGFNRLTFGQDGAVDIKTHPYDDFIKEIEAQSLLFYLDVEHQYYIDSGKQERGFVQAILRDQLREIPDKFKIHQMQRDNAVEMWNLMEYANIERFQDHINENWRLKRSVHKNITSGFIDSIIERAYRAGATAAKVCGAGGGGFVYLIVPVSMQASVRSELSELSELKFSFSDYGTHCIFRDNREKR